MAQGTLWLQPIQRLWTNTGSTSSGLKAYFYLAGTTTAVSVFSDVGLTTAFSQPIVSDVNGIFAEIFLTPGTAYKVDVQTSAGVSLTGYPADNQLAVPGSAATLDQTETAGEALTAGQAAYVSDGSGGKNAGQLYKADSANTYSSTMPQVGIVPSAISAGAQGTFRTGGQITGLSVTIGLDYFVGTAGAITTTPPANARYLGQADSATSLILSPNPRSFFISPTIKTSVITPASAGIGYGVCGGRLTLTSGTAVTITDVTGATTIYFTPYSQVGSDIANIGLYDGSANWTVLPFAEISVALGTITSGLPYDVFAYNNSGAVALRPPVAWTNTTTRATALTLQNGVYVKTGATTDRYLGTFYTTSTTQTADAVTTRYLWNYYHRVRRSLFVTDATAGWTYTTATYRQANGAAANQVSVVVGVAEAVADLVVCHAAGGNAGAVQVGTGIGSNSTTALATGFQGGAGVTISGGGYGGNLTGRLVTMPAVGQTNYVWLEKSAASGTTTWGITGASGFGVVGLSGWIDG